MKITCSFIPNSEFTVGEIRVLECQGNFDFVSLESLSFLNINPYALKILKAELSYPQNLQLTVTGYQPNNYSTDSLQLTDGFSTYFIENISWNIPSVLKENQTQMYPPYGPINTHLPIGFKGGIVLIGFLLFSLLLIRIKNKLSHHFVQKRVSKRLQNKTPLDFFIQKILPFTLKREGFKDESESVHNLETALYEYLENKLSISLFISSKKRKKIIKKNKIKQSDELLKIILEFDRLKNKETSYSQKDLDQLVQMIRTWIFQLEGQ